MFDLQLQVGGKVSRYIRQTVPVSRRRYGIVRLKRPPEIALTDNIEVAMSGLWWNDRVTIPPPREQKGASIPIPFVWQDYHGKINDPKGHAYYLSVGNAICNDPYVGGPVGSPPWVGEDGQPYDPIMRAQPLTSSGNIHEIIEESPTHWMLNSFSTDDDPNLLDPAKNCWLGGDLRFFKVIAQRGSDGRIYNVQGGVSCYAALLHPKNYQFWIPKANLEVLQQPPFMAGGRLIVAYEFINGVDITGVAANGERVPLLKYSGLSVRQFPTDEWRIYNPQPLPA